MEEEKNIRNLKPILDTNGQIDHLIKKGVKFQFMSEDDARKYLEENNNYFRLRSYRKNFDKYENGVNDGKYIRLDFAALVDLSIIDMRLRYVLLKLVLDVEHFSKVLLLKRITDQKEDGYTIVDDYFTYLDGLKNRDGSTYLNSLKLELKRSKNNPYCGGIIEKYENNYPVWAFVEVIPMGSFIRFYEFCSKRFNDRQLENIVYLLKTVKDLRNAAAHSNCILYDMKAKDAKHNPYYGMLRELSPVFGDSLKKKLRNERTRQITTLLYTHWLLVTSQGVRDRAKSDLHDITDRMRRNIHLYSGNDVIISNFDFYKKVIDFLYA